MHRSDASCGGQARDFGDGSYHGRTVGAQLMTGNDKAKEWIGFEDPNIYHLPFPFPWSIESKNSEKFFYDSMNVLLKKKKSLLELQKSWFHRGQKLVRCKYLGHLRFLRNT